MSDNYAELAARFASSDDKTLEQELAARLAASRTDPAAGTDADFSFESPHLSLGGDALELGRRLYMRLSRELHQMLCGGAAGDAEDREKIRKAIGLGDGLVAVLTAVLVSSFGVMPAIAAIIAALLAKRIFIPGGEEVCAFWATKLPANS